MSENQYRHKWKSIGFRPHNAEDWYECEICGKKDWVDQTSNIDECIPFGCIPSSVKPEDNVPVNKEKEADALYKALKYVIEDLEIRSNWKSDDQKGIVDIGHGAYIQAKKALEKWEKQ